MLTLADTARAVIPYMQGSLVPVAAVDPLLALGTNFPNGLSSAIGFELRLGAQDTAADLAVRIDCDDSGRSILADRHPAIRLPEQLRDDKVWRHVRDFCVSWDTASSPVHAQVHNLWLELDHDQARLPVPAPGVFCGLRDPGVADGSLLIDMVIPLLRGRPLRPSVRRRLRAACVSHQAGVRVFQAGLLLARPMDAVRLCVSTPAFADLTHYLAHVGWRDPAGRLESLVRPLFDLADEVSVDVDVAEGIFPRLGIECRYGAGAQPANEPRWFHLLDYLVTLGACAPEKRDALLRFPGSSSLRLVYERLLRRGISHVKLIYDPGLEPDAKAYVGVLQMPLYALRRRAP